MGAPEYDCSKQSMQKRQGNENWPKQKKEQAVVKENPLSMQFQQIQLFHKDTVWRTGIEKENMVERASVPIFSAITIRYTQKFSLFLFIKHEIYFLNIEYIYYIYFH